MERGPGPPRHKRVRDPQTDLDPKDDPTVDMGFEGGERQIQGLRRRDLRAADTDPGPEKEGTKERRRERREGPGPRKVRQGGESGRRAQK